MEEYYSGCCKMPQLEQGKVNEVQSQAIETANALSKKIDKGFKVVVPVASCALMLKSHWPLLNPSNDEVKTLLSDYGY